MGAIALQKGKVRRVVTAHNADGKSYIANDEIVDFANIWNGAPDHPLGTTASSEPPGVSRATGQTRCFVAAFKESKADCRESNWLSPCRWHRLLLGCTGEPLQASTCAACSTAPSMVRAHRGI